MKKRISICTAAVLAAILMAGAAAGNVSVVSAAEGNSGAEKLKVVASFYPMADFAERVGGDRVEVINMIPAGTEPHDWEPSAKDVKNLEDADVFVYNGAGLEHWAEDLLATLDNKDLVVVEASKGLSLLEGTEHGEEEKAGNEAHDHGDIDPHVWLAPENAKAEMETVKDGLEKADPDNRDFYENNYADSAEDFDKLDREFRDGLAKVKSRKVIVAHEAFGYLCEAYNLEQVGIEGLTPDSEPDAARMEEIIEFAKENKISTIFFEELVSPKVAEIIADEVGAETAVLNPLEGLTDDQLEAGEDYFSVMRENLAALEKALNQ